METLGVFVGTSWGDLDAPRSWWRLGLGTEAQGSQVAPPRGAVQGQRGEAAVAQPEVNHSTPRQVG